MGRPRGRHVGRRSPMLGLRRGSHREPQEDVCRIGAGGPAPPRPVAGVTARIPETSRHRPRSLRGRPEFVRRPAVFGLRSLPAWVRFSSDTQPTDPLEQGVAGDCLDDYQPDRQPPRRLDEVPVAEQPDALTRAALDFCQADAFHPGCEMTWPMPTSTMYVTPYRIRHQRPGWVEADFGRELSGDVITLPAGPLAAQGPGASAGEGRCRGSATRPAAAPPTSRNTTRTPLVLARPGTQRGPEPPGLRSGDG